MCILCIQETTGYADRIVVNSQFTKSIFLKTFRKLSARGIVPEVLYPSINFQAYDTVTTDASTLPIESIPKQIPLLLSINRFERKKNIDIAIEAFSSWFHSASSSPAIAACKKDAKLVIAGGYDPRVKENVEYETELKRITELTKLSHSSFPVTTGQVIFLRSFNESQRAMLLQRCRAVIYTPENEHFGIVPIEAMYASKPVIASARYFISIVLIVSMWKCPILSIWLNSTTF
jgi:alpha-1,3/alpha-1,6-mannosyltransferase